HFSRSFSPPLCSSVRACFVLRFLGETDAHVRRSGALLRPQQQSPQSDRLAGVTRKPSPFVHRRARRARRGSLYSAPRMQFTFGGGTPTQLARCVWIDVS